MCKDLERKIDELQKENAYLRQLLENAGIAYKYPPTRVCEPDSILSTLIQSEEITRKHVSYFFSYFWGRMDVYAKRFQNKKTGKSGYFPQCGNFWTAGICPKVGGNKIKCSECPNKKWKKLEAEDIYNHILGQKEDCSDVIGVYPLFPDGTCRFLVFDFDVHDNEHDVDNSFKDEVDAVRSICKTYGFHCLVERSRSGNGAHLWLFFENPIKARLARRFGEALLNRGRDFVDIKSFKYYDRMIPAQDNLDKEELGNLIALPLQGKSLVNGNSAFVDENWNAYSNQWEALLNTEKLSEDTVQSFVNDSVKNLNESISPWEGLELINQDDVSGKVEVVLANRIYINKKYLSNKLRNQIRKLAAISNPIFYKNQAIGLSNYANSRYIYLGEDVEDYIAIPRGLIDQLITSFETSGIEYEINDKRSDGNQISVSFTGKLRENQDKAVDKMLRYENGILNAATAFGKTVVCSNVITRRKTSTLVLVGRSTLVEQWERELQRFIKFDDELPMYKTKSGREKICRSHIGIISGSKDTSGGIVDIAMVGSLCKNGVWHKRLRDYGMVIVDECHHSASDTISKVLEHVNAKYIYGVTATTARGDGLERVNEILLGPIRYRYTAKERALEQGIEHLVVPRFTRVVAPHGKDKININAAYEMLRDSELRNNQIIADIKECYDNKRCIVVLTKFTSHAEYLYKALNNTVDNIFLLTGEVSKKEQAAIRDKMTSLNHSSNMVLVATSQLVGEGFDLPRLDTLIMAMPVAWKGLVEQFAGRLNRDYEGKTEVLIYDYIDSHIPVFDNMYLKRLRAYKQIGYKIYSENNTKDIIANSIYDVDTYLPIFMKDIINANKEIVISSPLLAKNKVIKLLSMIKTHIENGLKVSIVTMHPDNYRFGRLEQRIELFELLRNNGVYVELSQERCERYAVIDGNIVWYGSVNLLFKDDVDDNIIRLENNNVASELLGISFCKESKNNEYKLPLE